MMRFDCRGNGPLGATPCSPSLLALVPLLLLGCPIQECSLTGRCGDASVAEFDAGPPEDADAGQGDTGGTFALSAATIIFAEPAGGDASDAGREDLGYNSTFLARRLAEKLGLTTSLGSLAIQTQLPSTTGRGIVLHRPDRSECPNPYALTEAEPGGQLRFEGFQISVSSRWVHITSGDPRGQRYAILWLLDHLQPSQLAGQLEWKVGSIADYPRLRLRALHLGNFDAGDVEKYLDGIAAARFNVVQWTLTNEATLDTFQKAQISTRKFDKDAIRRVLRLAAERHLVIVPALKLLTHQEKLFAAPAIKARVQQIYPGLLTTPDDEDSDYNPRYVFPANDGRVHADLRGKTLREGFVQPLLTEVVQLFSTYREVPTVAIGHDEAQADSLANLARDAGTTAAALFAEDVLATHDFLANPSMSGFATSKYTMMWSDLLLYPGRLPGFDSQSQNGDTDDLGAALDILARAPHQKLLLGDWHYHFSGAEYQSNDFFKDAGFEVAGATWFKDLPTLNFTLDQIALGGRGMIATIWGPAVEYYEPGNRHLIAYSGETFWRGSDRAPGLLRVPAKGWPSDSRIVVTDASGRSSELFTPGELVQVWADAHDDQTPLEDFKDWGLSFMPPGGSTYQTQVLLDVAFVRGGPPGLALGPHWRLTFAVPPATAPGAASLQVRFRDTDELPSATKHPRALFVGTTMGSNLLMNSSFEAPFGAVGWRQSPSPPGVDAGLRGGGAHTGSSAFCIAVPTPSLCASRPNGCSYWHLSQRLDLSTLSAAPLLVRYWLKASGRDGGEASGLDLVAFASDGGDACWPGKPSGSGCNVMAVAPSAGADHDWTLLGNVVVPSPEVAELQVRLRQYNRHSTQGSTCFDDVSVYQLIP